MNKRTIVGVLAVFMFLLIGIQTVTTQAKDLLKKGDNYFNQGNYDKAIEVYESIINRYPKAKEANDAKKKLAQAKAQASQRITTPLTDADFEFVQNPAGGISITGYKNEKKGIRDLVIPAQILGINVTEIAARAFANGKFDDRYNSLEKLNMPEVFASVTIPSTVGIIGAQAFCGRGIKTLTLPDSIRSIGAGAFAENQISSVTLPASLTGISAFAFAKNQLTSIDIPPGVAFIGQGAFGGNKLTKVTLPASVTVIGDTAFFGNQLTELAIPEGVTTISDYAFFGNKLAELTIPASVTTISQYAFANNMISKLTFPTSGGQLSVGNGAFGKNRLKSLVLPEGLTIANKGGGQTIGWYYFGEPNYQGDRFGDNPLGYIKIASRLSGGGSITNSIVSVVEWEQPNASFVGKADAIKVGDNINTSGFDQSFINYYISQGKKAGIYMRRGPIWVTITQEEFDAFIAEKTK